MNSSGVRCWLWIEATTAQYGYSWHIGTIFPSSFYPVYAGAMVYLAAACWLLCDYVDTIHDEVIYVWKQSLCLGSFLFFAMRYAGIISLFASFAISVWPRPGSFSWYCDGYDGGNGNLPPADILKHSTMIAHFRSPDTESMTYWLAPALQFLVFWLVEVIMQMRIFALYNSRLLAIVNGALFICEIALMLFLWIDSPDLVGPSRIIPGQIPTNGTSLLDALPDPWPIYWIPAIVFEVWLAGLALAKLRRKTLKYDLVNVLLKDSLMYFIMIAAFMILHVVLGTHNLGSYAVPFMIVAETVGGSRLVLHLRTAYFRKREINIRVTHPDVSFAMPVQVPAVLMQRIVDESFYTE